ncbi:hypothetical protein F4678DRAFT_96583 [Xylaria arbuscula]|nr:hypothetical protein F4678DRAFT_96583 [Xylaria arbuscula]
MSKLPFVLSGQDLCSRYFRLPFTVCLNLVLYVVICTASHLASTLHYTAPDTHHPSLLSFCSVLLVDFCILLGRICRQVLVVTISVDLCQ